jgi:hypothetical protein
VKYVLKLAPCKIAREIFKPETQSGQNLSKIHGQAKKKQDGDGSDVCSF